MYPTANVSYGQTSADVTKLQNFLIAQGFAIPAGATGYFGDQTKAALLSWQQKNGVQAPASDLGSNWGPLSIAAAGKTSATSAPVTTSTSTSSTTQPATSTSTTASQIPSGVYSVSPNGDGTYSVDTNSKYGRTTLQFNPSDVAGATSLFNNLGISTGLISQIQSYVNPGGSTGTAGTDSSAKLASLQAAVQNATTPDASRTAFQALQAFQTANPGVTATSSGSPASTSTPSGPQPPTVNLQPGDTGTQVKALQDYLVSKGLMTQAQVNTGYGTYGPQTTAAVAALQKNLGVDNSTGVGYFGPRTIAAVGTSSAAATGEKTSPDAAVTDPALAAILNNPNLTADQKTAIQGVVNGDADAATRLKAAMQAASTYSDPYFKAQVQLVTDALDRKLNSNAGDLSFNESQLSKALQTLKDNTSASEDKLSFDHAQELKQLQQKYETDLSTTQDNLAASGFTSSSKRARAEQILNDNNTGLVESSNKNFSYQTGNLDRGLMTSDASTQAQIANLQRVNDNSNLDLYRNAEGSVGSSNLPAIDGLTPLGGQGGTLQNQKNTQDIASGVSLFNTGASNFVF